MLCTEAESVYMALINQLALEARITYETAPQIRLLDSNIHFPRNKA